MDNNRDLLAALIADLEQIEDNSKLYRSGRESAYQAVAIQLRTLLLGGRRGLLRRVIEEPLLHQLRPSNVPSEQLAGFHTNGNQAAGFLLDVRGRIRRISSIRRGGCGRAVISGRCELE